VAQQAAALTVEVRYTVAAAHREPLKEVAPPTALASLQPPSALTHSAPRPVSFNGERAISYAGLETIPPPDGEAPESASETAQPVKNERSFPAPNPEPPLTKTELCNALLETAQVYNLPAQFFANLIWQESRFRHDAISPVGALGVAQFMPAVAEATGLDNPFDPLQAIPASARLLRELRLQLGNLGYAAAGYNAGPKRVNDWLDKRRALPLETRNYVLAVTGRSIEEWRKEPHPEAFALAPRLPCRLVPAYAAMEEARIEAEAAARKAAAAAKEERKRAKADKYMRAVPSRTAARQADRTAIKTAAKTSRQRTAKLKPGLQMAARKATPGGATEKSRKAPNVKLASAKR
jgi:soluble lytic murein transglycosylase-like protein